MIVHYTRTLQLCLNNNYSNKIPTPTIKVLPGNIIAYFFINLNDFLLQNIRYLIYSKNFIPKTLKQNLHMNIISHYFKNLI